MKVYSILVPIKGLPVDEEALQMAFAFAAPAPERRAKHRIKLEVIFVVEVPQSYALDTELPEAIQAGERTLAWAEKLAHDRELEVTAELLQARSAGAAIVDEAIERGVDLIILGAQYRRRHGEFNLGVTLPYVLKNAPCRVWVARAPRPAPEAT